MREQIESILAGLPDVRVQEVGTLWQIRIGNHAGAREDGVSLARDLRAIYFAERRAIDEPEPIEIPDFLLEPEVAEVVEELEPEPVPEVEPEPIDVAPSDPAPAEPAPTEVVPEGLLDLVRENEAYGDTQTRLWSLYLELNGKLMLGLATEEDARLHTRLHGHLAWISKGAAEVV